MFFIELVAFFFLRQYRAAMDEYRYFEALQRHREELLALIALSDRFEQPIQLEKLLENGTFYSGGQILHKDESTEIIESRKLEKNELDLLNKVVELVGARSGK